MIVKKNIKFIELFLFYVLKLYYLYFVKKKKVYICILVKQSFFEIEYVFIRIKVFFDFYNWYEYFFGLGSKIQYWYLYILFGIWD